MNVAVCGFGPIQSEFCCCFSSFGGHGKSSKVTSGKNGFPQETAFQLVGRKNGFLQGEAFRSVGRLNGSLGVSVRVRERFCGGEGQASQQQGPFLSSVFWDRSLSGAEGAGGGLLRNWGPSGQTPLPGGRWVGANCGALSPGLREGGGGGGGGGGWEEKLSNVAAGWSWAGARWEEKGSIFLRGPHFAAGRAWAAVSGGEEKVLLEEAPGPGPIASPREHRRGFMYRPFVDFAVEELSGRPDVSPLLLKEEFRNMTARDMSMATIDNKAFTSSKIRMFRIASIDTGPMQVLNVAGFARPEYDLPIFCADFFSMPNRNIVVLDLNPVYNTDSDKGYKERFYSDLLPLANKYVELLPWGDKLTAESLQFFSPIVLWTKPQTEDVPRFLYPAFQDYLQAWLKKVDSAQPAVDPVAIARNQEAQHRYISWRTTKDPGRPLLTKLYGEQLAERYIREFLFSGHSALGRKSFLDYFPEYRSEDGSILKQRSMIGKSFETRPWDKDGNYSSK